MAAADLPEQLVHLDPLEQRDQVEAQEQRDPLDQPVDGVENPLPRHVPGEEPHQEDDDEPREDPVWELATDAVAGHFDDTEGNILVFMPGSYEIQRTIRELQARLGSRCAILPLHGELPAAEQDKAVNRGGGRKIIVSTNVAETSLTIDGITLVVDSGLARIARQAHRVIHIRDGKVDKTA